MSKVLGKRLRDDHHRSEDEREKVAEEISKVLIEISEVKEKIAEVAKKLSGTLTKEERNHEQQKELALMQEKTALMQEKTALRRKEAALREKELLALKKLQATEPSEATQEEFTSGPYKIPSIGKITPSRVEQNMITDLVVKGAFYSHWFALALYDIISELNGQGEIPESASTFVGDQKVEVSVSRIALDRIVDRWLSVSALHTDECHDNYKLRRGVMCNDKLRSREQTATAILGQELDRFLFSNDECKLGACYHQMPIFYNCDNNSMSVPDFFITKLEGDQFPEMPIAVSDYKNKEISKADTESSAYSIRLMELQEKRKEYVGHLVFPVSGQKLLLQLHVGMWSKMLVIDIISAFAQNREQLEKFFYIFRTAVHLLIKYPITSGAPVVQPTQSLSLREPLRRYESKKAVRVFKSGGHVYKLYDTLVDSPNISLVEKILPEAEIINLSQDGRFQMLTYNYRNGSDKLTSHLQFCDILEQLQKIHDEGFVHSDIRGVNIVFSSSDEHAWLIDLDLAGKEHSEYPTDFNRVHIMERHVDARPGQPREKVHDLFALTTIMKTCRELRNIDLVKEVHENGRTLHEIAESIKQMDPTV